MWPRAIESTILIKRRREIYERERERENSRYVYVHKSKDKNSHPVIHRLRETNNSKIRIQLERNEDRQKKNTTRIDAATPECGKTGGRIKDDAMQTRKAA